MTVVFPGSGKDVAVPGGNVAVGGKVLAVDADGKVTAVPNAPADIGDRVVVVPTEGLDTVLSPKAGSPSTDVDVDPLKMLMGMADLVTPGNLWIAWQPGDNNTDVQIDVNVDGGFPKKPKTGEISFSFDTTRDYGGHLNHSTWSGKCLRYFAWHYISGWGVRNGRYSKKVLHATAMVNLDFILGFLKCYVTARPSTVPSDPDIIRSVGTIHNVYMDEVTPSSLGLYGRHWGYKQAWVWYDGMFFDGSENYPMRITRIDYSDEEGWHWGPAVQNMSRDEYTIPRYVNVTELMDESADHELAFDWPGTPHELMTWTHYYALYWLAEPAPPPAPFSWWIYGNSPAPPGWYYDSGAYVCNRLNGGKNFADITVYFDDGASIYNLSWIALKVVDPDNGILEVWAQVNGVWSPTLGRWLWKGRDQELYFGDIKLCDNIDHVSYSTSYHGWLGISLLGDLSA